MGALARCHEPILLFLLPRAAANGIKHAIRPTFATRRHVPRRRAPAALMRKTRGRSIRCSCPAASRWAATATAARRGAGAQRPHALHHLNAKTVARTPNHLPPTKQKHDLNATLVFTKAGIAIHQAFQKTPRQLYFFAYVTSHNPTFETFPGLLRGAGHPLQGAARFIIVSPSLVM